MAQLDSYPGSYNDFVAANGLSDGTDAHAAYSDALHEHRLELCEAAGYSSLDELHSAPLSETAGRLATYLASKEVA